MNIAHEPIVVQAAGLIGRKPRPLRLPPPRSRPSPPSLTGKVLEGAQDRSDNWKAGAGARRRAGSANPWSANCCARGDEDPRPQIRLRPERHRRLTKRAEPSAADGQRQLRHARRRSCQRIDDAERDADAIAARSTASPRKPRTASESPGIFGQAHRVDPATKWSHAKEAGLRSSASCSRALRQSQQGRRPDFHHRRRGVTGSDAAMHVPRRRPPMMIASQRSGAASASQSRPIRSAPGHSADRVIEAARKHGPRLDGPAREGRRPGIRRSEGTQVGGLHHPVFHAQGSDRCS